MTLKSSYKEKIISSFKKHYRFIILLIFISIFLIHFGLKINLLLWDENAYLSNASHHIRGSSYTELFRFPLLEWIISLFWLIFGEILLVARLVVIAFSVGSVILTYVIGNKIFGNHKDGFPGLIISMIFCSSFVLLYWGFRIYTEPLGLFFTLLSFYFLTLDKPMQAGFFIGIAFLAKFNVGGIFLFSAVLYYLYNKRIKNMFLAVIFFILPLIPWLIYNQYIYGNALWNIIEQYKIVNQFSMPQPVILGIRNLFVAIPFLLIFIPFGIYSMINKNINDKNDVRKLILFYVLIISAYFLFFVNMKDIRYLLLYLPFLIFILWEGIELVIKNIKHNIVLYFVILSIIMSFIFATIFLRTNLECASNSSIVDTIDYLSNKVNSSDAIISNHWPWYGYSLKTRVSSIWTEDINELLLIYHPKYFIISNQIGEPVSENFTSSKRIILDKEFIGRCSDKIMIYKPSNSSQ
jgi:4-amino-4-deoxy-L-arabinose transferase-like glycosyltransferase